MSFHTAILLAVLLLPGTPLALAQPGTGSEAGPAAQSVINSSLDCGNGYHTQPGVKGVVPDGWTALPGSEGTPYLTSTQVWGRGGSCDPNEPWWKWEKIEGHDSFMFMGGFAPLGQDFPSPPFDATLYQRVKVTLGTAYSLSAWMMSLCGGSAMPNDCPEGQYIAKLVGIDPTGGTELGASRVSWVEDRRPHYDSWWVDFSLAARAQSEYLTIFLRARSPFAHHGNHAFADGVQLVRSPSAEFVRLQQEGGAIALEWRGDPGEDIRAIPSGNYRLYYSIEYQTGAGRPWRSWQEGVTGTSASFKVPRLCSASTYRFRVRATAEQPQGEPGAWPPHRFVGLWQESGPVNSAATFKCTQRQWLPRAGRS